MSDNEKKTFGERLNEFWNYLKKYKKNFQLIFTCLFIGFVFEKLLVKIYDDTIVRLLSEVNEGWFFACIMFAALIGFAWRLWKRTREKYLDAVPRMILLIALALIYVRYRFTGAYIYYQEGCWIKYLDVLFLILLVYGLYQILLNYKAVERSLNPQRDAPVFISGHAIKAGEKDELEFSNSAKNIADRLSGVPADVSFSIGINSAWGDGKSSYLNLVRENIDKNRYIVIDFNPVESKEEDLIQVNFFEKIKSVLQKYSGEVSSLIDNYMKAIGILDESNFMSKIRELKAMFYDGKEEEKLKAALSKIGKRLVVIIDDIDRLTPEEAFKTIKLIRYAASNISNIIFITAYDRNCINQFTKNEQGDDLSLFWDKFFDMEIQLPYRHNKMIISYIGERLQKWLKATNSAPYKEIMEGLGDNFQFLIRNLRDAKRFLNNFYMEYLDVKEEVKIEHLLYVKLLKYRYIDVFYALRAKKFIEADSTSGIEYYPNGIYRLKNDYEEVLKNIEKDPESVGMIKKMLIFLFPNILEMKLVRPINDVDSFETYFQDEISNTLSLKDIISLFTQSEQDAMSTIDEWNGRGCIDELIYYLKLRDYLEIEDKETFELCVKLSFNLLAYTRNYYYYKHLTGYFNKTDVAIFSDKYYNGDRVQYKKYFADLFERDSQEQHIYHDFVRLILAELFEAAVDAKGTWIFDRDYFVKYACKGAFYYFKNQISKKSEYNLAMGLELLKNCIQDVSNNISVLSQVACLSAKEYIVEHPVEYLRLFIKMHILTFTHKAYVFPDICYKSIFANDFEAFLYDKRLDKENEVELVRNFWELFKSNNYTSIECKDEINSRTKMNAEFSDGVKKLCRAREIRKDLLDIAKQWKFCKAMDSHKKNEILQDLNVYQKEFESIEIKTMDILVAEKTVETVRKLIQNVDVVSKTDA